MDESVAADTLNGTHSTAAAKAVERLVIDPATQVTEAKVRLLNSAAEFDPLKPARAHPFVTVGAAAAVGLIVGELQKLLPSFRSPETRAEKPAAGPGLLQWVIKTALPLVLQAIAARQAATAAAAATEAEETATQAAEHAATTADAASAAGSTASAGYPPGPVSGVN